MNQNSITRFIVLLSISLTLGCSSSKNITKTDNQANGCIPIQMVDDYEGIDSDPFDVQEVFVDDNCLNVILTYGGGCGDVNYEVFYNDVVLQSYPPQVFLNLKFTDNDPCRAIEMDTVSIDLSWFQSMARAGGLQIGIAGSMPQATYALPLR